MFDSISKPKLPRGFSYVLKTSWLEQALLKSRIDCHIELNYWLPQQIGSILECEYWPANDRFEYARFSVRAGAVQSSLRRAALESLTEIALPRFVNWVRGLLELPHGSPLLSASPDFRARYLPGSGLSVDQIP